MAFTQNTTIRLHYTVSSLNKVHPKHAKKFVLIHGLFFGNLAGWYPLIHQKLSEHGEVLCYDLRGHGLSEMVGGSYLIQDHLNDLKELLIELGWWDYDLCFIGHSFGGRLGLAMATSRRLEETHAIPIRKEMGRYLQTHLLKSDQVCMIDPPLNPTQKEDNDTTNIPYENLFQYDLDTIKSWLPPSLTLLMSKQGRQLRKLFKRWQRLLEETSFSTDMQSFQKVDEAELQTLYKQGSILFGKQSGCIKDLDLVKEHLAESNLLQIDGGHFLLNECPHKVIEFLLTQIGGE